jgi:Zn-dependent peptidase ImmA (M78 family)
LNQYKRASLFEAIERAAYIERETLLPGMEDYLRVPVNVEAIAERKGIIHDKKPPLKDKRDAEIFFLNDYYHVRMGADLNKHRNRFSLAHEIGHTLFSIGSKHHIGIMGREEIGTEENICNMFASALLMPKKYMEKFVSGIPSSTSWSILNSFEEASIQLQVSIPSLISRIAFIRVKPSFSFIGLYLKYIDNKYTKESPCLRVETCSSVGDLRNMGTWNNKSALGMNLKCADYLFNSWSSTMTKKDENARGKFTLLNGDLVRTNPDTLQWVNENVELSVLKKGKWYKEIVPMLTMNCLYVHRGTRQKEAYIITILKKPQDNI